MGLRGQGRLNMSDSYPGIHPKTLFSSRIPKNLVFHIKFATSKLLNKPLTVVFLSIHALDVRIYYFKLQCHYSQPFHARILKRATQHFFLSNSKYV